MNYLEIAEDFTKRIWPYKNKLKIKDIMLYGSVAYGKNNPSDLDLLILHQSEKLEKFQEIANSKVEDVEKLIELSRRLNEEIDLLSVMNGTMANKLIFENKFNVKYIDIKFFTDNEYRKNWKERDLKIYMHEKSKKEKRRRNF